MKISGWKLSNGPYYPDIPLFLLLIPAISAFNYYLTYTNIEFNWFLAYRFAIDTLQGYLAWIAVRAVVLWLDKIYPYENAPLKRIALQQLLMLIVGLFVIASTTELLSVMVKGKMAPLNFYTVDLVIISIWFFAINGVYVGLYFYNLYNHTRMSQEALDQLMQNGFVVKLGKSDIKIPFEDLLGLTIDGEYAIAHDLNGKKYLLSQSLDQLEKFLPDNLFFRLNRQAILSRQVITGFKRAENGKINVQTNKPDLFGQEIAVSRLKAPAFKTWFK